MFCMDLFTYVFMMFKENNMYANKLFIIVFRTAVYYL